MPPSLPWTVGRSRDPRVLTCETESSLVLQANPPNERMANSLLAKSHFCLSPPHPVSLTQGGHGSRWAAVTSPTACKSRWVGLTMVFVCALLLWVEEEAGLASRLPAVKRPAMGWEWAGSAGAASVGLL